MAYTRGKIDFYCGVCPEKWEVELKLPMPVDAFVKFIRKSDVCPKCGAVKQARMSEVRDSRKEPDATPG